MKGDFNDDHKNVKHALTHRAARQHAHDDDYQRMTANQIELFLNLLIPGCKNIPYNWGARQPVQKRAQAEVFV